jgi:hypothetical protein
MKKAHFIILSAIGISILFVFGVMLVRLAQPPAPPLEYTQDIYQSERTIYAPGETLTYTASLTIKRAGVVDLVRGWRTRPAEGRARLCNGENAPIIAETPPPFSPGSVGTEVEGRINVVIPQLPPGDYWLVSSVLKRDGGESLTRVPVTIHQACG